MFEDAGGSFLGGEPTLNPELISIIELARQSFPNAEGLFVTNGFFLGRHPDLPRVLIDNRFRMDVSQHGRAPEYMMRFRLVRQQLRQWRTACPKLRINIRKSHRGWRQQYRMIEGKPMPFESDPQAAWNICLQRTCTQIYKQCLWKCPALAYQACPPTASDDQVREFLAVEEVRQCGLCPAKAIAFRHRDPTAR